MIPEFKFALKEGLSPEFLPTRAHDTDTGFDVRVANNDGVRIRPFEYVLIDLGFRAFLPEGWWCKLVPRSSTFAKKNLHCLYGTIDNDYENFWRFACQYQPNSIDDRQELYIPFGDPIGQIIPVKRQEMVVTQISNTEFDDLCNNRKAVRGTGGFGSTG